MRQATPDSLQSAPIHSVRRVRELTPDDLRGIEGVASRIAVHGARYPKELERMTDR